MFCRSSEVCAAMSPSNNTAKIERPILLVHCKTDNNTGALHIELPLHCLCCSCLFTNEWYHSHSTCLLPSCRCMCQLSKRKDRVDASSPSYHYFVTPLGACTSFS